MSNRRLLICFAHPDDETFGLGGLIAKYIQEGVDVHYVCATNGDAGTMDDDFVQKYGSIKATRLAELECAAEKLGFHTHLLDYKDSGMPNDPTINDPECLVYNWHHNPDGVLQKVVHAIRELKPQVVVTFNEYGGYGHPDHIAIQQATVQAIPLAADPMYTGCDLPPYQVQKLYYSSIPAAMLRLGLVMIRLQGKNPRKMGRNNDIDFQAVVDHIDPTHTRVDISPYLELWNEANACHASQGGGSMRGLPMPDWLRRRLMGKQGLTRIIPAPSADRVDEDDIFAGVRLEETAVEAVR